MNKYVKVLNEALENTNMSYFKARASKISDDILTFAQEADHANLRDLSNQAQKAYDMFADCFNYLKESSKSKPSSKDLKEAA